MTSGLPDREHQVLQLCYDEASQERPTHLIDALNVVKRGEAIGLADQQVYAALERLSGLKYITVYTLHHRKIRHFLIPRND